MQTQRLSLPASAFCWHGGNPTLTTEVCSVQGQNKGEVMCLVCKCADWQSVRRWREKPAWQVGSRRLELSLPTCAFSHRNLLAGSSRATFSMWCCKMGGTSLGGPCSEMIPAQRSGKHKVTQSWHPGPHILYRALLSAAHAALPGSRSHRLVGFPFCTLTAILRVHLMCIYGSPVIKRNSGTNK